MNLVTVIIVNWNGRKMISRCLDSLRNQTCDRFKTILVDNGSRDGSVEFVRSFYPEVDIISLTGNVGFAAGNNVALKKVSTPYVALLNNDAEAASLWLETLYNALERNPEAGFAASKMCFLNEPGKIDRVGDSYTRAGVASLRGRGRSASRYRRKEWIFGACAGAAVYRTSMLKDIGFFDPDFFLLYEDVDLSFRAQLKGYRCLYVPEAVVYHQSSASIGYDSARSVYYGHRNLEWTYIKNMPSFLVLRTIASHCLYDIAALLYFGSQGLLRPFIKAKIDAFKGLDKNWAKRRRIQASKVVSDTYLWKIFESERFFPRLMHRASKKR